jgi:hypothetical protein
MRNIIAALVLCAVASPVAAQFGPVRTQSQLPELGIGTRVRILTDNHGEYIGKLMHIDSANIVLNYAQQGDVSLNQAVVRSVWVSGGRHRNAIKGALIGAGFGSVYAAPALSEDAQLYAVGVFAFGLLGAQIGRFVWSERWIIARPPS